jgi:hypothetical protein
MKLYIAGPMTGIESRNFPAFDQADKFFRQKGYEVINPAILAGSDVPDTGVHSKHYFDMLKRDIRLLVECDAIAMLPGWQNSKGARLEYFIARTFNLIILDAITGEALELPDIGKRCQWCNSTLNSNSKKPTLTIDGFCNEVCCKEYNSQMGLF